MLGLAHAGLDVEHLKHAVEQRQAADQRGIRARERRRRLVQLREVGRECDDRPQGHLAADHEIGAERVQQRGTQCRQSLDQHRQPLPGQDLLDLRVADPRVDAVEALGLARLHAEAFHDDGA